MKTMRTNYLREKFTDPLRQYRVDPGARPEAMLKTINRCFVEHDLKLFPGDLPFKTARNATLKLLRLTSEINAGEFWTDVWDLPSDFYTQGLPEPSQDGRKRNLVRIRKRLRSETITQKSLVRAMQTIDDAIKSMQMEFSVALIPEKGLDTSFMESERYKCAAMLGAISNLLRKYWYPIRDQLPDERPWSSN